MVGIVRDRVSVEELKRCTENVEVVGNLKIKHIKSCKSLFDAEKDSLVWVKHSLQNYQDKIEATKARVIICAKSMTINSEKLLLEKLFLKVDNPRLAFSRIVRKHFQKRQKYGIDKSAIIHPEAKLSERIYVGPNCYIGKVDIGDDSILEGNNFLYDNIEIGKNARIQAGAVIGSSGFGFEKNKKGEWEEFPQIGRVVIGDDVQINANTTIARGTLGDTFIGKGVKIDANCQIAHNVIVGKDTIITGNVQISGSVSIGRNCWISPSSTILNGVKIGDNSFIGIGSVVVRSVKAGTKVFGNPARKIGRVKF